MSDLGELFYKAREYGRVNIFTSDNGTYSCNIDFNTIDHVKLEAKSGYRHLTIEDAVSSAIHKAEEIIQSLNKEVPRMQKLLDSK